MNDQQRARLHMLATLLRSSADAAITGERDLCLVAVQTAAEELLRLHEDLLAKPLPIAA